MLTAAAVQMTSDADVAENLAAAGALIAQAAAQGAGLVVLPENFALMARSDAQRLAAREVPGDGPIQDFLATAARRHGVVLVGGTVPLAAHDPQRVRAACLVYGPDGTLLARYDKLHLFDVDVGESGGRYRESAGFEPGDAPVVADTPVGRIGLAVCYDLRFPELFRALAERGAQILVLPSAFTEPTGRAHWHVLVRARAIENLCHLIAPAQGGQHATGRRTYGHSLIVNAWGEVLSEIAHDAPGVAAAPLDLAAQEALRARFPALAHRRLRTAQDQIAAPGAR
jgi:deaminated glutathione amidase